jgi:predicted SAM-dependent methyltransferase
MAPLRLDIGCGDAPREGFVGIDRRLGRNAFPLDDYDDGSVDEIYASHILEHAPRDQCMEWLSEWFRVMKPGARIRLGLPDFAKIATRYLRGDDQDTLGYVMGGNTDEHDRHYTIWDWEQAREVLEAVGFEAVSPFQPDHADTTTLPISLNVEAFKPREVAPKVLIVYSCPRYIPSENIFATINAVRTLGWPVHREGGAYWHHGICRGFDLAIAADYDIALTIDYDTVFSATEARRVVELLWHHDHAGGVYPLQMRRKMIAPLFSPPRDPNTKPDPNRMVSVPRESFAQALYPCASGHFGLTAIRLAAVKDMPRPHMVEDPGTNYGEDRVDADVAFWHSMNKSGWQTCLAPNVVVGHIQELVTWPDMAMRPLHQPIHELEAVGMPREVFSCV